VPKQMNIQECRIIQLPKIADPRGNLTFIESRRHIPFTIKRVYYLYDVPGGATRAGHAMKTCHKLMLAVTGSFDVTLSDGERKNRYHLNRSYYGLYVPPMVWREIDDFSSGSVCLVLASEFYDENDYYRNYQEYVNDIKNASIEVSKL
jgi:dTDP-4-dehydrorhamnose 3,5-epimerase-like enzyme